MDKSKEKDELIIFLSKNLPILSEYINKIVVLMPKELSDLEPEHIDLITPKVKELLVFTRESIEQIRPSDNLTKDDEIKEIYKLYFQAVTDILDGVEKLHSFLLDEEGVGLENIVIFIEKLYDGSKGIMELVDRVTE